VLNRRNNIFTCDRETGEIINRDFESGEGKNENISFDDQNYRGGWRSVKECMRDQSVHWDDLDWAWTCHENMICPMHLNAGVSQAVYKRIGSLGEEEIIKRPEFNLSKRVLADQRFWSEMRETVKGGVNICRIRVVYRCCLL